MKIQYRLDEVTNNLDVYTITSPKVLASDVEEELPNLAQTIQDTLAFTHKQAIGLDLSNIEFMSSAVYGRLLLATDRKARGQGKNFLIIGLNRHLTDAVHQMKLDKLLGIYTTREQAAQQYQ
ncbi:MAG: STAS domain-containing protein [Nanoarchaeota archaeon]